ncbi:integrin alpha-L-like [Symphorus nematophorus]
MVTRIHVSTGSSPKKDVGTNLDWTFSAATLAGGFKVAQAGDDEISQDGFNAVFYKVCSPSVVHDCYRNSYLNSVCYKMTDDLQQSFSFTPAFQDCTEKTMDLVFLFDGSGSMTEGEFNKNKDFIVDIMNSLKNTSVKFAAVQFSTDSHKVFDFNDYQAGRALDELMKEPHMRGLTNTHKALKFVLEEILENSDAGASPDATKLVVLITDGNPSDQELGIIKRYKDKNIIRSKVAQSGFSAVFSNDTLILGSVRSNSWRGSLQEQHEQNQTQSDDPDIQTDSYLGNTISVGEKNNTPLYFMGAPRFERTGQVVLLRHDGKNWTAAQRITGDQIDSHFGAELCSVDVDSDNNTDFLLVGAPLFYQPQEKKEGQIYIYTLTDEMQLKLSLNVTAPSMGRFGTTISSLADLNGDGLRDVAVGAPLEDDNRGVVYIFLGDKHRGICSTFSQRIMGQTIMPGFRFFGQAIDGDTERGEDGLPSIVVGSQGTTVVLRSKPVFDVLAHLFFQHVEISTEKIDCTGSTDENLRTVVLTGCFEMVETTERKEEAESSRLSISYTLEVDPMKQTHRGFFSRTDKTAWNLTSTHELSNKFNCFVYPIYMPICVNDISSPISIRLNFLQADSERANAILNVDSKTQVVVEQRPPKISQTHGPTR